MLISSQLVQKTEENARQNAISFKDRINEKAIAKAEAKEEDRSIDGLKLKLFYRKLVWFFSERACTNAVF
jgi:hypothetical protein